MKTVTDETCNHGTSETELCDACEQNENCHWNEGSLRCRCEKR